MLKVIKKKFSLSKALSNLVIFCYFRWNEIIGNNGSTMKSLPLIISNITEDEANDMKNFTRKYVKIILNGIEIDNILGVVENIGSNVTELICRNFHICNANILVNEILKKMPVLEKILFNSVTTAPPLDKKLEMKNLKRLVLNKSSSEVSYAT